MECIALSIYEFWHKLFRENTRCHLLFFFISSFFFGGVSVRYKHLRWTLMLKKGANMKSCLDKRQCCCAIMQQSATLRQRFEWIQHDFNSLTALPCVSRILRNQEKNSGGSHATCTNKFITLSKFT